MNDLATNSNSRSKLGRRSREKWSDKTLNRILMEVIGPILIILMIGALVYFLIEIFYRGPHAARLGWVLGLFTIAAVLVSRISIEGGPERALLFGVPLAAATLVVTITLVDFEYGSLAILEPVVVAVFIFVVMWSANRLTWDCTMIDESRDVSSIGLTELVKRKFSSRKKKHAKAAGEKRAESPALDTSETVSVSNANENDEENEKSLGSRLFFLLFANKRNKNTPGLWVFYFSMAAFPIFGFGQWFAQPSEGWGYRWIFFLFAVYLGAGLGLLMLTSLLGLERYLNKRGAELPTSVSGTWMTVGTLFALAVMLVMLMLPSPSISNGLENAFAFLTTNNKNTSEHAIGKDGQEKGEKPQNKKVDNKAEDAQKKDAEGGEAKGKGKNGKQKSNQKGKDSGGKQKGNSKDGKSKKGDGKKGKQSDSKSKDSKSKEKSQGEDNSKSENDSNEKANQQDQNKNEADRNKDNRDQRKGKEQNRNNNNQNNKNNAKNDRGNNRGKAQAPKPPQNAPSPPSGIGQMIQNMMKYLVYGLGIVALIVVGWLFRDELAKLLSELFGGKEEEEEAKELVEEKKRLVKPLPPFTQFQEPFSNGAAESWSAAKTIEYTFQALEAWGRGFEHPRDQDQTPHEFAMQLGAVNQDVSAEARQLADLHGESLFSGGDVDRSQVSKLKRIWKLMASNPPRPIYDPA